MYPVINTELTGRKIKELMDLYHLVPRDIQDYLSLSCVQTVYRWLDGKNIPSIDHLYALSELFHVSIDEIVQGNKNEYGHIIKEYSTHYCFYH